MNLNEIRHVVITVAKSRIDDYLLNPPYWVMSPSDGGPVYEKAPAGARAWEVSGDFQLHDV